MQHKITRNLWLPAGVVIVSAAVAFGAQLKNLNNTATLPVNGLVRAASTPQNTGSAMELELHEFLATPADGTWLCRVIGNATGQPLHMRLIGVDGSIIRSCTAPAGGVCNTQAVGLAGGHRYACLVATQIGAPAVGIGTYTMAVQRGTFPLITGATVVSPSGEIVAAP
jgi:hypothetical protein